MAKHSPKKRNGRQERDKHGRRPTTERIPLHAGNIRKYRNNTNKKMSANVWIPRGPHRSLHNKLLTKERVGRRFKASVEYRTRTVIPHIHGMSHKLKRIAECSGGRVVFLHVCDGVQTRRFMKRTTRAVYEISLSYGGSYIGQTGECVNDRLHEHANAIKSAPGSNLAAHVS